MPRSWWHVAAGERAADAAENDTEAPTDEAPLGGDAAEDAGGEDTPGRGVAAILNRRRR